jgi:hypothetical protein
MPIGFAHSAALCGATVCHWRRRWSLSVSVTHAVSWFDCLIVCLFACLFVCGRRAISRLHAPGAAATDCNTECNLQRCSLSTCAACPLIWSPAVRLTPYTILSVYCRPTDWWQCCRGRLQGCIGCGQQCCCSRLRWPCGAVPCRAVPCRAVPCLGWTFSITSGCARVPQLFAERLDLDRVRTDAAQHTTRCNAAYDPMQRSIRHDATQHPTHKVAPRAYLDNAAATAGTTQDTAYSMLRYSIHRYNKTRRTYGMQPTACPHAAGRRSAAHPNCNMRRLHLHCSAPNLSLCAAATRSND